MTWGAPGALVIDGAAGTHGTASIVQQGLSSPTTGAGMITGAIAEALLVPYAAAWHETLLATSATYVTAVGWGGVGLQLGTGAGLVYRAAHGDAQAQEQAFAWGASYSPVLLPREGAGRISGAIPAVHESLPVVEEEPFSWAMVQQAMANQQRVGETIRGETTFGFAGETLVQSDSSEYILQVLLKGDQIGHPWVAPRIIWDSEMNPLPPETYYTFHAEKMLSVAEPGKPIGVSQIMCSDCRGFLTRDALASQELRYVADPGSIRVFLPDGQIAVINKNTLQYTMYPPGTNVTKLNPPK